MKRKKLLKHINKIESKLLELEKNSSDGFQEGVMALSKLLKEKLIRE